MSFQSELKAEIRKIEQLELKHRSGLERLATTVLTGAVLFSLTGLGHNEERQRTLREVVTSTVPTFQPVEKTTERNETVRMEVKFDDGLRALATTGE